MPLFVKGRKNYFLERVKLATVGWRLRLSMICSTLERNFSCGLAITALPLPDHHDFLDHPFDALSADVILITEKDAVKCGQIENLKNDPRLWVVPVTAQLDAALAEQIVEKCRGCSTA